MVAPAPPSILSLSLLATTTTVFVAACKSTSIPSVELNDGVRMPVIALGTGGYDNDTAAGAVLTAFEAGMTHVHTAYDYYNLPGVGEGLSKAAERSEMFLTGMTSPCIHTAGNPKRNVTDPKECYDLTMKELHESLDLLGMQYVDLMLLHGPSEPFGYEGGCSRDICALNAAQWRAYQDFQKMNKTRSIGVSNYCQSCIECLLSATTTSVTPSVNQIQYHVGMGQDPESLPSYCRSKGIVVQAYSPLAAGGVISSEACIRVGQAYNKTSAQVGLRWVLQQPSEPSLVVKSKSPKYIQEDISVFDWSLSPEDMDALNRETEPKGQQDGRPSWGCAK